MPITTDLDKFRLELGDTDTANALFNDDEANYFIAKRPGNVLLAVADACDSLARRFAGDFDFETDGQKFGRSSKSKAYADQAKELRARANGIGVMQIVRQDARSSDLSTRDGAGLASGSRTGRVRQGYTDPDLPV